MKKMTYEFAREDIASRGVFFFYVKIEVIMVETKFELFRVSVKFPIVETIWQRAVGVTQSWKEIPTTTQGMLLDQMKRMALKIAYEHEYDKGCIICFSRENGRISMTDIVPVAIKLYDANPYPNQPFQLGADPEFILTRHRHPLIAKKYLPYHREIGTDLIRLSTGKRIPALAELRPLPATTSLKLTMRIGQLINLADAYIVDTSIHFIAGSMPQHGLPLGGHIHFSGITCTAEFIRCLDNYLALPLALLETNDPFSRRPKYGFLGDIRMKHHGGFEYRTLPSWLESPDIALGVLELATFIAVNHTKLRQRPLQQQGVKDAFYLANISQLMPAVKQIWDEIQQHSAIYANFHRFEPLFSILLSGYKWSKSCDFRLNWRVDLSKK
jgi:hypothetical protein